MRGKILLLIVMLVIAVVGNAGGVMAGPSPDNTLKESSTRSETDIFIDLNTGKAFRFIYDELNDKYERDDLLAPDLYVNTRTKDSFWLAEAVPVNNALLRDANGNYRVNPMKVKRDGAGYKVINNKPVQPKTEQADKPKDAGVTSM